MAYFPNSDNDINCCQCKYGESPCPVAWVQINWNYDACNNKTARAILDFLVKDDGTCQMWEQFKKDFEIDPNQENLFKEME